MHLNEEKKFQSGLSRKRVQFAPPPPSLQFWIIFENVYLTDQLYSLVFQNALRCYCRLKIAEVIQIKCRKFFWGTPCIYDEKNVCEMMICWYDIRNGDMNFNDFRLSLCKFTPDCLSNQLLLGTGETKLVAGEEKCSSGQVWYCSGYRGEEMFSGETQKCHLVGFHWVRYRGMSYKWRPKSTS